MKIHQCFEECFSFIARNLMEILYVNVFLFQENQPQYGDVDSLNRFIIYSFLSSNENERMILENTFL